eukprot:scpid57616/ scgid35607/ 
MSDGGLPGQWELSRASASSRSLLQKQFIIPERRLSSSSSAEPASSSSSGSESDTGNLGDRSHHRSLSFDGGPSPRALSLYAAQTSTPARLSALVSAPVSVGQSVPAPVSAQAAAPVSVAAPVSAQ